MPTESAAQVWYVELKGPEAARQLADWMTVLPTLPHFLGAELLESPAQPELALVASRWADEVPALSVPAGAKAWAFRVVRSLERSSF